MPDLSVREWVFISILLVAGAVSLRNLRRPKVTASPAKPTSTSGATPTRTPTTTPSSRVGPRRGGALKRQQERLVRLKEKR